MLFAEHPKLPMKITHRPVQLIALRNGPTGQPFYWNLAAKSPSKEKPQLRRGGLLAVDLLKAVMSSVCLCRTKAMKDKTGKPLVALPPLTYYFTPVEISPEDRAAYDEVAAESARHVAEYFDQRREVGEEAAKDLPTYSNVLSLLTRMRQLALHSSLLPPDYLANLREKPKQAGVKMTNVTDDEMKLLQRKL